MKKSSLFSGIQFRIALIFSLLIIVTMVTFVGISYYFFTGILMQNQSKYTEQLLNNITKSVDTYITNMEDVSRFIATDSDVVNYLKSEDKNSPSSIYLKGKISELLYETTSSRTDIANIAVLGADPSVYILSDPNKNINPYIDFTKEEWYIEAVEADGEPIIAASHVENLIEDSYSYVVSLYRGIKDPETGEVLGVVLVDLNYSKISELCSEISLGEKGYVFIIDESGEIVYHPQQQLIYSDLKEENIEDILAFGEGTLKTDDEKVYMIKNSEETNWRIVGTTYTDEMVYGSAKLQIYYIVAASVFILISLLASYYFSHRISKPITSLQLAMKEVEKGNFGKKINIDTNDEIEDLSNSYNVMVDKIKDLMEGIIKDEELKRKNELKVLQAQINPHFLYNTLDSIIWMAEMGDNENVVLMTDSLAKLFKISISHGAELITIGEEIEYVKSYLTIQKMRYRDKISFTFEVSDSILKKPILKLLLQPLIENSIYHGLKNRENGGEIIIYGFESDGESVLQVYDTGVGMKEEDLIAIFSMKSSKMYGGVGVSNVNDRIKLYFGDQYGLTFESQFNKYTIATIRIP